jgi:hypothetical protein
MQNLGHLCANDECGIRVVCVVEGAARTAPNRRRAAAIYRFRKHKQPRRTRTLSDAVLRDLGA